VAAGSTPKPVDDWQTVEPNDWQTVGGTPAPAVTQVTGTIGPAPLRERLTQIQRAPANETLPQAVVRNVGNIGAGAMAPLLHPVDTLESIGGTFTAPFEMMAGRKFSETVPGQMAKQFKQDPLGTTEATVGSAATMGALEEVAPRAVPEAEPKGYSPRTKALTRASGTSGAVDIPKAWERAAPEVAKTVVQSPEPYEGIKGLQKAVQDTFDQTQNRYSLGLQKIATQEAPTTRIGENIRALKIADPVTAEEIDRNTYLDKMAAEWDKRHITYRQADRLRETAGNDIRNYYSKVKPSDASAAAKNDIDIAINRIVDQDLGDVVYPAIDHANGLPEGTTRNLKLTQSSLYKLRDQLASQGIKMSNEEAQTLLGRLRAHSYISSHGTVGAALGGLAEALNPETSRVNRAVRKGLAPTTPTATPEPPSGTTPKPIAPRKHPTDEYAQQ
jgi:hypothetical protein